MKRDGGATGVEVPERQDRLVDGPTSRQVDLEDLLRRSSGEGARDPRGC